MGLFSNISMKVKVNTCVAFRSSAPGPSDEFRDVSCYLGFHAYAIGNS